MARLNIEATTMPLDGGGHLIYLRRDRELICHGTTTDVHDFVVRVEHALGCSRFADGPVHDDRSLVDLRRAVLANYGLPLCRVPEVGVIVAPDPKYPLVLVMPERI